MKSWSDRGAAAVEFALVLPVLLVLSLGIVAFGHAFHVQTVLDNAARDAVRIFTLQTPATAAADARDAARAAVAPTVNPDTVEIAIPTSCPVRTNARVTVTLRDFQLLTGFFGEVTLTGSGTMRCNG